MPTEEDNNKKYTLTGLYMTEGKTQVIVENGLKRKTIEAITIFNNNQLTKQTITIYDLEGIGRDVRKGEEQAYSYSISREAQTLLLQQPKRNSTEMYTYTYTFSDDFNTIIDNNQNEYKSYKGSIDEYYISDDLGKDISSMKKRQTDFEGDYLFMTDTGQLRKNYVFNKDGIVLYKNEYSSIGAGAPYYYWIKDKEIFIYKSGVVLKGVLSDDKKSLELPDYERNSSLNLTYKLQ